MDTVAVISASGKKLMPTSSYRARRLLKSKRAVIYKYRPVFTIKSVYTKNAAVMLGYNEENKKCTKKQSWKIEPLDCCREKANKVEELESRNGKQEQKICGLKAAADSGP